MAIQQLSSRLSLLTAKWLFNPLPQEQRAFTGRKNGGPKAAVWYREGSSMRQCVSSGTSSSATMLMILISGFTAGPAVSL